MFTALYQQHKEAKLLNYWGEGHAPSSPANIEDMLKNIFNWFDKYLDIARDSDGEMLWIGLEVRPRGKSVSTPTMGSAPRRTSPCRTHSKLSADAIAKVAAKKWTES